MHRLMHRAIHGTLVLVVLLSFCFSVPAFAGDVPIVAMEIEREVVAVGEPVRLQIKVLAPTWFPKPPQFPSFELANAMTVRPPDSSYPISERVDGETWSGILRSYEIYPLIAATYQLEAATIHVTWADPATRSPLSRSFDLPAIRFRAVVPRGAEVLNPYLAGRALAITREIEGDVEALSVGDALVVRYVAELDGLAAVFLPPLLEEPAVAGAAVYAAEPVVEDAGSARRVETLTLVLERGGDITLPGVDLEWWNTEEHGIETASVPELTLSVKGSVLANFDILDSASPAGRATLGVLLLLLAAAGGTARRWLPPLLALLRGLAERRRQSERYAYGELRQRVRAGEPRAIHIALLLWLERLQPGLDARRLAREHGDESLREAVEALSAALYSERSAAYSERSAAAAYNPSNLLAGLTTARTSLLRHRAGAARTALPPLNP